MPVTHSPPTLDTLLSIGGEIRRARLRLQLTSADLAEKLGITRQTVGAIEAGSPKVAIGTVLEMAHLLSVTLIGIRPVSPDAPAAGCRQSRVRRRRSMGSA